MFCLVERMTVIQMRDHLSSTFLISDIYIKDLHTKHIERQCIFSRCCYVCLCGYNCHILSDSQGSPYSSSLFETGRFRVGWV
jgi:hypothetical protein